MGRRIPTWTGLLILLAVIGLLLLAGWGWAERSRSAAEAESFALLAGAQTPAELREAAGDLGVVFDLRGGGWVAVR
jgi:hypothetical protein